MAKALPDTAHPRAHLTMREFAELLQLWGFKPVRERRANPHHVSLRGPHGGRVHVLASLQGRADADQVARAAHLAHVNVDDFIAGPSHQAGTPRPERATTTAPEVRPQPSTAPPAPAQSRPGPVEALRARGDSVVSQVLTTHARYDRPMRFEEIVDLCAGKVTRAQVREASAHLRRNGQLERICEGVYQWAHGARRSNGLPAPAHQPAESPTTTGPVDALFTELFPGGIRITPKLLRDLQQWTELTQALAAHAESPR